MAGHDIGDLLGDVLGGRGGTGGGGLLVGALLKSLGGDDPLGDLLAKLRAAGLGLQTRSWVGPGADQSVTGDELRQALGTDLLDRVAREVGISPAQAADDLAQALPPAVDRLTPDGEVPTAGELEELLRRQTP
jgi:uncharacterized protein YidB (DUF937 family)